jgi:hypothetical protein
LAYARGEADVQIELRYIAGPDRNWKGPRFDPSEERRVKLVEDAMRITERIFDASLPLSCSVWIKGYRQSEFLMGA